MNEKVEIETPKTTTKNNNKLKIFLVFLIVVIIGVTVFMVLKKQKDIEEATSNPSLPNQAEIAK